MFLCLKCIIGETMEIAGIAEYFLLQINNTLKNIR
jgi:hypothetical protein